MIQLCHLQDYNHGPLQLLPNALADDLREREGVSMTNWVEREAKRTNRNLLIVNLVSLAVCLAMMFPLYEEEKKEANFTPMVALVALVLFTAWNCLKGMR